MYSYLLHFNKIFNFEDKLAKINAISYAKTHDVIAQLFDEKQKAIALVGNTDKPFPLV